MPTDHVDRALDPEWSFGAGDVVACADVKTWHRSGIQLLVRWLVGCVTRDEGQVMDAT